jgi:CheY-like chemotaxis protein
VANDDVLKGKKILIVDDESDVQELLEELLDECDTETASTFEDAKSLLEQNPYDVAILDIMGVNGLDLLDVATEKKIPALMLTARGLNPDNLIESIQRGAKACVPKEKMAEIDIYLREIFIAKDEGVEKSGNWFARLGSFFEKRFGVGWKDRDIEFWDDFDKNYTVSNEELKKIKHWVG